MSINLYLAMTAAEFSSQEELPPKIGWMACHFSCYGTALTNLPSTLPEGSIVIVDDCTPPSGHDGQKIAAQLSALAEQFSVSGFLLDFQRPNCEETAALAKTLVKALPCPVGVSDIYARNLSCPVFLPPPPLHKPLREYLAPWKDREIWLEAALQQEEITVTPQGSHSRFHPWEQPPEPTFYEEKLHCRYHISVHKDSVVFSLTRDKNLLQQWLQEAKSLGVTKAVGLYQQLGNPEG